ncbi:hypothetical protein DEG02_011470 [Xanthomonas vasicola]|nr:hypothetical protein DEF98_013370 [Xanthomonas vasicola]RJL86018.1 hypothetical protein DEG03_004215 [Xanthomonas vasicola]RJL96395.1 hypothetical protein DEF96_009815 [Xanthomonas vasicola]RJM00059.1 hypothetical protein DEG05_003015 [Xanthomonas vasicola]RJN02134.1 hypothetical protein DEF97_010675 [Xanthomonas vasicola]
MVYRDTSGGREFLKWLAAIFMTGDHALKILVFGYVQCPARSYIIYRICEVGTLKPLNFKGFRPTCRRHHADG